MKIKHGIIGVILILLDQLLKIFMVNVNMSIIPNFLNLTYTENIGGAFGIGTKNVICMVSILIIIALLIFLIKENRKITCYFPYIFILSGSIGNLIDRIFRGYVIDYIDVNLFNFPNFNLADIFIVFGIFSLIVIILLSCKDENNREKCE